MVEYGFEYLLCVLTHGDPADLHTTLASFDEHVTPAPTRRVLLVDAARPVEAVAHVPEVSLADTDWTDGPGGFCRSSRLLWTIARYELCPWVFWLEHDFVFTRPVDLQHLAIPLIANEDVAQMSLLRNAITPNELLAGGLYEAHRADFHPEGSWMSHRSYFTTNPSLMRRDFMHDNPWPRHLDECEGKFGLDLVKRGYRFGVWGEGEPWVRHIGHRTGTGY